MSIQDKSSVAADFIPKANWKERFDALSDNDKNILYFTAIHTAPLRKTVVQELCKQILSTNIPATRTLASGRSYATRTFWPPGEDGWYFEKLVKDGWIRLIGNTLLYCADEYREQIIRQLVQLNRYQKYADTLFAKIGGQYFFAGYHYSGSNKRSFERPSAPPDILREFRHLLITKNLFGLNSIFPYILQSDSSKQSIFYTAIKDFCSSEPSRFWFDETSMEIQSAIGQFFLIQTLCQQITGLGNMWEILLQIADNPKSDPLLQIILLDYAFCAGKLDDPRLNQLSGNIAPVLLDAHRSLFAGNYKEAVRFYRAIYKILPNLKLNKNLPIPYLSGIFHCLAEFAAGEHQFVSKMIQATSTRTGPFKSAATSIPLESCWIMLNSITRRLNGLEPNPISLKTLKHPFSGMFWLSLLLYGYEGIWFQLKTEPELNLLLIEHAKKNRLVFPWAAAELLETAHTLGAAKQPDSGWVETFRAKSKSLPFRDLLTPRKPWEFILDSLEALVPATTKKSVSVKEKEKNKSRLIWRVKIDQKGLSIEFIPYEQKWNEKSQSWTTGKPIALSRLYKSMNTFPFLTDQDRDICSSIQVLTSYGYRGTEYDFKEESALKFIGHPLLFSAANPSQPIELVKGHGEISMQEKNGQWHVTFSPSIHEYHHTYNSNTFVTEDKNNSFFIIEETPLRFKVIKLSKPEMQIRTILGAKGQFFPKDAETSLTALLGKFAGTLMVKTDARIEFADVPEVPAD
ncbi:MAG: hypothetical protein LBC02_04285, partial [Planctomycetaceae bacterium]|nr:hypothetical protein [Planctomycetaceae bacterium]